MTLGTLPTLTWIDKRYLSVDRTYQRDTDSVRSRKLIQAIADNFSWERCGTLVVVKAGENEWRVLDGQHRLSGAMKRTDLRDLPCYVVDAPSVEVAAKIFYDMNKDRVALSALAMWKAKLAAGDPETVAIKTLCDAAGVRPLVNPVPADKQKPGDTLSIESLRSMYRTDPDRLSKVLGALMAAYPNTGGQLTGNMLRAVFRLLTEGMEPDEVTRRLLTTNDAALLAAAITARAADYSLSVNAAYFRALAGDHVPKAMLPRPVNSPKQPFRFKRSARVAPKPVPVEIRGDVQPRRIESGSVEVLIVRAFAMAKKKCERWIYKGSAFKVDGKALTMAEALEGADKIRKKHGLAPLSTQKAG